MSKIHEKISKVSKIPYIKFFLDGVGIVLYSAGLQIFLPLFLGSFSGVTSQYFVNLWCSILFNIFFWPITFYKLMIGKITKEMRTYNKHWKIALVGICDGISCILIINSSSLDKTPGALQSIFNQTMIPFSLIFSKCLLGKKYIYDQKIGAIITLIGILISLIPIIADFNIDTMQIYWPLIYVLGMIPYVLENVIEEGVYLDVEFDDIYLLSWECLYQLITILLLFWTDIVPGFGASNNIFSFWENIMNGLSCVWTPWNENPDTCDYSLMLRFFLLFSYCFSYFYGNILIRIESADSYVFILTIAPAFSIFFWVIFKDLNKWAGGVDYTSLEIICYIISLLVIIAGVSLFRKGERKQIEEELKKQKSNEEPLLLFKESSMNLIQGKRSIFLEEKVKSLDNDDLPEIVEKETVRVDKIFEEEVKSLDFDDLPQFIEKEEIERVEKMNSDPDTRITSEDLIVDGKDYSSNSKEIFLQEKHEKMENKV